MPDEDTIAALATPPGEAAIGIVRMSGPRALDIAREIFRSPGGGGLKPRRVHYGFIVDPRTGQRVDEVLLTAMEAPRTYTRQDVAEINCHGGTAPLRRVLELVIARGARLAEPGEFTKRAFLGGRIDLSQAEAVLDLIRAKGELAEKLALEQLRGTLSRKINALREKLLGICAHLEAWIDFPEEEIEPRALDELKSGCEGALREIEALAGSFDEGRYIREGLRTAIVGKPNVGKSSLLNALLERDRAIVTEMPGTTRDVIEEHLSIDGLPVRIMDTAGIREAHDMAEEEGVRRSMRAMDDADLVLGVLDASQPLGAEDMMLVEKLRESKAVLVLNKCDLPRMMGDVSGFGIKHVSLSAKTGHGIDGLKEAVFASSPGATAAEGVLVANLRHRKALEAAGKALGEGISALGAAPLEITAMELREALDRLGEIVGAVTTEDILERIFSEFCIGK